MKDEKEKVFLDSISRNIKELMNESRMTQRLLAERSGVSDSVLSNILSGRRCPSVYEISRFAAVLGVSETRLIHYPWIIKESSDGEDDAVMQIRIKKDKLGQVLKVIMSDADAPLGNGQ